MALFIIYLDLAVLVPWDERLLSPQCPYPETWFEALNEWQIEDTRIGLWSQGDAERLNCTSTLISDISQ
jgi:hypothetical protein